MTPARARQATKFSSPSKSRSVRQASSHLSYGSMLQERKEHFSDSRECWPHLSPPLMQLRRRHPRHKNIQQTQRPELRTVLSAGRDKTLSTTAFFITSEFVCRADLQTKRGLTLPKQGKGLFSAISSDKLSALYQRKPPAYSS